MSLSETRFGGNATGLPIAWPAPLPSLPTAFSRRAALFGAVAATGFLGAATASGLSAADARLSAIADELQSMFEEAEAYCAAHPQQGTAVDPALIAINDRYVPLEDELAETPAATLAGVLAKARAARVPTVWDCAGASTIALSVVDDLHRLHLAGVL